MMIIIIITIFFFFFFFFLIPTFRVCFPAIKFLSMFVFVFALYLSACVCNFFVLFL